MSGIATAVVGSAVVGAYASKKSGDAQAKAAEKGGDAQVAAAQISADAQKEANQQNIDFQKEIFQQQRADQAPWRNVGADALRRLQGGIQSGRFTPGRFDFDFNFDPSVEDDPGYQFRRQEGINALDASAASRGRLQSGAQARATTRYASDLASQEYSKAYAREADRYSREFNNALTSYETGANSRNQQFNQLASLANVGQVANQSTQAARSQMAQSVGQSTQATGNAIAQGALRTGNALATSAQQQGQARASSYQNMAGAANQGMQNYLLYNMMGG